MRWRSVFRWAFIFAIAYPAPTVLVEAMHALGLETTIHGASQVALESSGSIEIKYNFAQELHALEEDILASMTSEVLAATGTALDY
jgi:hypothetical protein